MTSHIQPKASWEERFDKFWYETDIGAVPEYDAVKAFISQAIAEAIQEERRNCKCKWYENQ